MKSAREVAISELVRWETSGEWSQSRFSGAMRSAGLDRRDAALATFLAGGVLQNRIFLDWRLEKLSKIPLKKLERRVLMALRLGAFQLWFADAVPDRAAINETVKLVDRRSAGFVNAVLRAAARVENPLSVDEADPIMRLSVRYSHPEWIVRELVGRRGFERAERELSANNSAPPITLRTNTRRISRDALIDELNAAGADARAGALDEAVELAGGGDIAEMGAYKEGKFWVQDVSSQLAVRALGVLEGESVLDLCASPGGKSFGAACAGGRVVSNDIGERKITALRSGAERLGFSIETSARDGREPDPRWLGTFDRVLCDAPCSGLGIIRKKPDIRYKSEESVAALPDLQYALLKGAARCVRPGGRLVYSTCTWRRAENEDTVEKFFSKHPEFLPEKFDIPPEFGKIERGSVTLWSENRSHDGFFICVMVKKDV